MISIFDPVSETVQIKGSYHLFSYKGLTAIKVFEYENLLLKTPQITRSNTEH